MDNERWNSSMFSVADNTPWELHIIAMIFILIFMENWPCFDLFVILKCVQEILIVQSKQLDCLSFMKMVSLSSTMLHQFQLTVWEFQMLILFRSLKHI